MAALVGATLLGAPACVVSPQPLPPIVPTIDVAKLSLTSISPTVVLHGAPGAVTADATFSALGITSSKTDSVVVSPDGSFDLTLTDDAAQLYRVEASLDGEHSVPIDLEAPGTAVDGLSIAPASPAYAECLTIDPATVTDRGAVKAGQSQAFAIQLQNGCAEDLTVDDVHLVTAASAFTLSTSAPLSVPAGAVRAVSLAFTPSGEGDFEDVLVLHVAGSAPGFIVVTLRGQGTP
ncbi:MAG: hypothetical protein U0414_37165 [Polyangiaceae bacterium]